MAPTCQLCDSVGTQFSKGTMSSACLSVWEKADPSSCLDARQFSSSLYAMVPFKLLPWCWSSEEVSLSPCVGSLRGTACDSRNFFHWLRPHWFLQPDVVGTYLSCTENLGWGGLLWGWDSSLPRYPSQIFIHHTWMWDQPILLLYSSTCLGGVVSLIL